MINGDVPDDRLRAVRECRFRHPLTEPDSDLAECDVLRCLAGPEPVIDPLVTTQVCMACRSAASPGSPMRNPVIASRLHELTTSPKVQPRDESQVADLCLLREYSLQHLERRAQDGSAIEGADEQAGKPSEDIDQPTHRYRGSRWPHIGMIGLNTPTGLGYQCRDITERLPAVDWLIPSTCGPQLPRSKRIESQMQFIPPMPTERNLRQLMESYEWLLFVETPIYPGVTRLAKQMGLLVACVCNWEWTCPVTLDWLHDVDLMICPTLHSHQVMRHWRDRFGFPWQLSMLPWPIRWQRFRFRPRTTCQRFVFVNGTGGCRGRRLDQSPTPYRRKGAEVLFEAARLVPSIPIIVYSQTSELPPVPDNVEIRRPPDDNRQLYEDGDICVQPSHWEGLGLPLLECQAAGMPLLTTNAAPMCEHNPLDCFAVDRTEMTTLQGVAPVAANIMRPEAIAAQLEQWFKRDIAEASVAARNYVAKKHDWKKARSVLRTAFRSTTLRHLRETDANAVL